MPLQLRRLAILVWLLGICHGSVELWPSLELTTLASTHRVPSAQASVAPPDQIRIDLEAEGEDIVSVLRRLARESSTSILFVGPVTGAVTMTLRQVTFEEALALIARAGSFGYTKEDNTYVISKSTDSEVPRDLQEPVTQEVYRAQHVRVDKLVQSIEGLFGGELKVILGPDSYSPRLVAAEGEGMRVGALQTTGELDPGLSTREVIIVGKEILVARAIAIMEELDHPRHQVKINVTVADFSTNALREFGLQWDWTRPFVALESPPESTGRATRIPGLGFGSFAHEPVFISAALSALEVEGKAKLLAKPSLTLMDGERGFILIGEKLLYPRLDRVTDGGIPVYSQQEVKVGIYVQIAVRISDFEDITLSVYPQVSAITGFLTVSGASYPQISTREQQTTIRAKSGETFAIGGLIREDEIMAVNRVPWLGRIPIFGELFTFRRKTKIQTDLVMMITPQIIP